MPRRQERHGRRSQAASSELSEPEREERPPLAVVQERDPLQVGVEGPQRVHLTAVVRSGRRAAVPGHEARLPVLQVGVELRDRDRSGRAGTERAEEVGEAAPVAGAASKP